MKDKIIKHRSNCRNFRTLKVVGTRASDIDAHISATASFEWKPRIEKVWGNNKKKDCFRKLHAPEAQWRKGEAQKTRDCVVKKEIRSWSVSVAEISKEKSKSYQDTCVCVCVCIPFYRGSTLGICAACCKGWHLEDELIEPWWSWREAALLEAMTG